MEIKNVLKSANEVSYLGRCSVWKVENQKIMKQLHCVSKHLHITALIPSVTTLCLTEAISIICSNKHANPTLTLIAFIPLFLICHHCAFCIYPCYSWWKNVVRYMSCPGIPISYVFVTRFSTFDPVSQWYKKGKVSKLRNKLNFGYQRNPIRGNDVN